uniref:F-box domain-containing protein n=1 Tax=Panagrolaimus sp. ES5 TaxID=591445 RepID=A0AC34F725_9BILA
MESVAENVNFPMDILKWMKLNAHPKMSLKLMQVCKYFQHVKFPYFVVKNIYGKDFVSMYSVLGNNDLRIWQRADEAPDNLWITDTIFSDQVGMNFMSLFSLYAHLLIEASFISKIIQKIVVCDIKKLELHGQDLTLKEFKFLTASGKIQDLSFSSTLIKEENGGVVFMDTILDCLPNVESIFLLAVSQASPNFPHMQQLQNYVDQLVRAGSTQHPPPVISFPGQSEQSKTGLMKLYSDFYGSYSDEDDDDEDVNEDNDDMFDEE